jgi:hypothetical protein
MSYVRLTWSFRAVVASSLLCACADASRDDAELGQRNGLEEKRDDAHDGDGQHGGGGGHGGGHDVDAGVGQPEDECAADGREAAETGALSYCDMSIALGGLAPEELLTPGPESACSCAYEEACQAEFDRIAAAFPGCAPFTTGEFTEAYESARFNQCLFSVGAPGPVPPPDPCADGVCECRDQPRCDVTAGEDANVQCVNVDVCEVEADSGKVSCEHVSTCQVDCADCEVECRDVERCQVELGKGSVRCDDVGDCQVECEGSGHRAPTCCSDGRYVCGQGC